MNQYTKIPLLFVETSSKNLRMYLGFATLFVTLKIQYFIALCCWNYYYFYLGTLFVTLKIQYQSNNFIKISTIKSLDCLNAAVVLLKPAARIFVCISYTSACVFSRINFFHLSDIFSTVGKKTIAKLFNRFNTCCKINVFCLFDYR